MSQPPRESELTASELDVLKVLWDLGPTTVRKVMNELHERGRDLAYTTVLTFLSRLEQKGFVRSDRSGMAYVYEACINREAVTSARLSALVEQLFDGAVGPLVLQLVQHERLSDSEIAQLQTLIDDLDGKPRTRRRS